MHYPAVILGTYIFFIFSNLAHVSVLPRHGLNIRMQGFLVKKSGGLKLIQDYVIERSPIGNSYGLYDEREKRMVNVYFFALNNDVNPSNN